MDEIPPLFEARGPAVLCVIARERVRDRYRDRASERQNLRERE